MSRAQRSVLVFRSAALGDFVISSPALKMVRETHPGWHVILVTIPSTNKTIRESVARYSPANNAPWGELVQPHLVDEVHQLNADQLPASVRGLRKVLADRGIARSILLLDPGAPWIGRLKKIFLVWALAGVVPVYGWRARGSLRSGPEKLKQAGLLGHHVHGPLQFLSELTPPVRYGDECIRFDLRPSPDSQRRAEELLADPRLTGKRLVAVAPGSIQPHKRWPLENFQNVVRSLLLDYEGVAIVVVGTAGDWPLGDQICSLDTARCVNMAGMSSIPVSAALLARCTLLIGNDGGAMHLGDAMGCKVISIVPGIEYPDSIEPWNSRTYAIRHKVDCAPCYSFLSCPEGHNKCMNELPVIRVLENCRKLLTLPSSANADADQQESLGDENRL